MYLILNSFFHFLYKTLFKPIAFILDPEFVHDRILSLGVVIGNIPLTVWITEKLFSFQDKSLEQTILGIHFKNPIGLSAGFDKDGVLLNILPSVGFGFVEIGSITGEPCIGNPKPRLWRLIQSKSLVVYYGLKNRGSQEIAHRLKNKKITIPFGTNIAKTNSHDTVDTQNGISDYAKSFALFSDIGAYFTINISCPNAYGGQPFTDPKRLENLLATLDTIPTKKPIFLKLSPDLSEKEVDAVLDVAQKHKVSGFVCANLTKERKPPTSKEHRSSDLGGMSGKIVEELSNQQIAYVYKKTKGKYVIIGVGGVFNAADAYKKIKLGANLVALVTGMIFEGPQQVGRINYELLELLKKDGYTNISEARGTLKL